MVILAAVSGGAIAGAIDVETPTSMPAGVSWGAWAGAASVIAGLVLSGAHKNENKPSKLADGLIDVGTGALSYEVGTAVAAYALKSKAQAAAAAAPAAAPAVAPTASVQGLPGQRVSAANASVRAHLSRMRAAA